AVGPYVCPAVNAGINLDAPNLNMITCGGQATVPVVAAVSRAVDVPYAEIVASIASRSAGPGTRANIDEFTEVTAKALEDVGMARVGVFLAIRGRGDHLPDYAGNLDIITAAAVRVGDLLARHLTARRQGARA